jgi:glycosyltransferase involved in cell wall biosynthesis
MTHHILAPFHMIGGGIWHAIDLATTLAETTGEPAQLWSTRVPNSSLQQYKVRTIAPYDGDTPNGGYLWVVGPDNEIGHWYPHSHFERVTLIYNQHAISLFYRCMHALTMARSRKVNVCYISTALANETGVPGTIIPPAFDRVRFIASKSILRHRANEKFTVGKASRDVRYKHHMDDPDLYQSLLANDYRVELIGATCINDRLPKHPQLEVYGQVDQTKIVDFLLGLDCLFYRTSNRKAEGFGLCILEAMALGLPVVAHKSGGYIDIIKSGKNGFLFEDNEEALRIIESLKNNPDLRQQVGILAMDTVKNLNFNLI